MKKNGFVFIESVTVLIVVILSLTLLISSYTLVVRKSKENEYYNLPSLKYLLYIIGNLGDNTKPYNTNSSFIVNKDNCNEQFSQRISSCSQVFEDNDIVYFLIIRNLGVELNSGNVTEKYNDSALLEYLKTLKKCLNSGSASCKDDYAIGVFKRNNKYYYASLEL